MERYSDGPLVVLPIMATAAFATFLGITAGEAIQESRDNVDGRVAEVQAYNEDLRTQLTPAHKIIAHLTLKEGKKTYSFETVDPATNKPETCSGTYEVDDDQAVAIGKVACTITTPVPKKG